MNLACETCPVKDSAACSVLTEEERDALAAAGRTRTLKRGEMLFAAGDEDAACATLVSGALKVSAIDADGNEQILALVHPSGFIGELFRALRPSRRGRADRKQAVHVRPQRYRPGDR